VAATFEWRGRAWTLRPATELERETLNKGASGMLFEQQATIIFDDTLPEDLQIQTILHEAGHAMFPEWDNEPSDTSKSELGVFERDMKAFLEALGVDLSPLLEEEEDGE
jgi:hypothetical protein